MSTTFPIVCGRKDKHWISSSFHSCFWGGRPPIYSFLPWGISEEGQSSPSQGSSPAAAVPTAMCLLQLPPTKLHQATSGILPAHCFLQWNTCPFRELTPWRLALLSLEVSWKCQLLTIIFSFTRDYIKGRLHFWGSLVTTVQIDYY